MGHINTLRMHASAWGAVLRLLAGGKVGQVLAEIADNEHLASRGGSGFAAASSRVTRRASRARRQKEAARRAPSPRRAWHS